MTAIFFLLRPLLTNRRGATATEYVLIAAVIGGLVISSATSFGNGLSSAYSSIGTTLSTKATGM